MSNFTKNSLLPAENTGGIGKISGQEIIDLVAQSPELDKKTDAGIAIIARAGLGTLNPNPTFVLGSSDYENYIAIEPSNSKIVKDDVDNTAGSLYIQHGEGYTGTLISDNFYPVNIARQFRASISVKVEFSGSAIDPTKSYHTRSYLGVISFDSDKAIIMPQNVTRTTGSQTELAAPLNNGDMTITIVDGSGFYQGPANQTHRGAVLLHRTQSDGTQRYIGVNGRKYDHLGYSRHMMYYAYDMSDPSKMVDNGDGTWTIGLKTPWNLGSFATGDAIRNSYGGGTYNYWISGLECPANTNEYKRYSSAWGVSSADQYNHASYFRNGVAYAKMMLLPVYLQYEDGVIMTPRHAPPNVYRKAWYSTLSLDWRHIP